VEGCSGEPAARLIGNHEAKAYVAAATPRVEIAIPRVKVAIPCVVATVPGGAAAIPCVAAAVPGGAAAIPCIAAVVPCVAAYNDYFLSPQARLSENTPLLYGTCTDYRISRAIGKNQQNYRISLRTRWLCMLVVFE
jgi:hypothetical protein